MALDPNTIQKEREKIPQVEVSGTVSASTLIEHTECIDTYSSIVDAGTEKVDFQYSVLSGLCTTDSIYDIVPQPFAENANVRLSLSQNEPQVMVSGNVLYTPSPTQSFPIEYMFGGVILLVAGIIIGVCVARMRKNGSA